MIDRFRLRKDDHERRKKMRIAVAALKNNGLDSKVSRHLSLSPYFAFVDLDGQDVKTAEFIANPYIKRHTGGQVPIFIKDNHADVIISGEMGTGAAGFFADIGIETATGASGTINQALEQYHNGELASTEPGTETGFVRGRGQGRRQAQGRGRGQGQGRGYRQGRGRGQGRRRGSNQDLPLAD
jgi:predicted Fe-Mo cluster-binding NifX family protein